MRRGATWRHLAWALLTAWRHSHVVTNVGFQRLHGQLIQGRHHTCLVVKLRRRAKQLEPAGPHGWQDLLVGRVGFATDCHEVLCARDEPRAGTAWAIVGSVHWPRENFWVCDQSEHFASEQPIGHLTIFFFYLAISKFCDVSLLNMASD